jgi:hypothetical protein
MIDDDDELEEDAEFLTAGQVAEFVSQEFDEDELVHWGVWCKSDVESHLGRVVSDEQWIIFLRAWTNNEIFQEVREKTWLEAVELIREEIK